MSKLSFREKKAYLQEALPGAQAACNILGYGVAILNTWAGTDNEKPALSEMYPNLRSTIHDLFKRFTTRQKTLEELSAEHAATLKYTDNQLEAVERMCSDFGGFNQDLCADFDKLSTVVAGLLFPESICQSSQRDDLQTGAEELAMNIGLFWSFMVTSEKMIQTLKVEEQDSSISSANPQRVSSLCQNTEKLLECIKAYQEQLTEEFNGLRSTIVSEKPMLSMEEVQSTTIHIDPMTNTLNDLFVLAIGDANDIGSEDAGLMSRCINTVKHWFNPATVGAKSIGPADTAPLPTSSRDSELSESVGDQIHADFDGAVMDYIDYFCDKASSFGF